MAVLRWTAGGGTAGRRHMAAEPGGCAPSRGFTAACFSKHSSWLMQEEKLWNGWSAVGWWTRWNIWPIGPDGWTADLSNQVWGGAVKVFLEDLNTSLGERRPVGCLRSAWGFLLVPGSDFMALPCWKSPYLPVNDSFLALSFPFEEMDRSRNLDWFSCKPTRDSWKHKI